MREHRNTLVLVSSILLLLFLAIPTIIYTNRAFSVDIIYGQCRVNNTFVMKRIMYEKIYYQPFWNVSVLNDNYTVIDTNNYENKTNAENRVKEYKKYNSYLCYVSKYKHPQDQRAYWLEKRIDDILLGLGGCNMSCFLIIVIIKSIREYAR